MFDNRMLRKVFGPKMGKVTGWWGKLKSKSYDPFSSPNNIRVIKARPVRWAGYVARTKVGTYAYRLSVGILD